jgi:hypothetical protein
MVNIRSTCVLAKRVLAVVLMLLEMLCPNDGESKDGLHLVPL